MSGIHSVRILQPMVLSQYLPEQGGRHSSKNIDIDYSIDICAIIGLSKSHILEEGQAQDNTLDFQNISILQWGLLLVKRKYSFSSILSLLVEWCKGTLLPLTSFIKLIFLETKCAEVSLFEASRPERMRW